MTTPSTPLSQAPPKTGTPILEARGLNRSFGHVRALNNANFDIYPGEVVALIGDNGAGKSTMVKALTGNLELDSGELFFEGQPVMITNPEQASAMGMEVVYQDLALAPHLNPVQNMFPWPAGLHGRKGHAGKSEGGLRGTRRYGPVIHSSGRCDVGGAASTDRHCPRD
jgi:ABC-type branched-subunit amino acid transport system ATPase component